MGAASGNQKFASSILIVKLESCVLRLSRHFFNVKHRSAKRLWLNNVGLFEAWSFWFHKRFPWPRETKYLHPITELILVELDDHALLGLSSAARLWFFSRPGFGVFWLRGRTVSIRFSREKQYLRYRLREARVSRCTVNSRPSGGNVARLFSPENICGDSLMFTLSGFLWLVPLCCIFLLILFNIRLYRCLPFPAGNLGKKLLCRGVAILLLVVCLLEIILDVVIRLLAVDIAVILLESYFLRNNNFMFPVCTTISVSIRIRLIIEYCLRCN